MRTTRVLLVHVLEMLRHSPAVDRVESQLLLFDAGEFADLFAGPEYTVCPRLFLECDIRPGSLDAAQLTPRGGFHGIPPLALTPWTPQDYQAAGELIYASYGGHHRRADQRPVPLAAWVAALSAQYRAVSGMRHL
jgi:hypothetical protein